MKKTTIIITLIITGILIGSSIGFFVIYNNNQKAELLKLEQRINDRVSPKTEVIIKQQPVTQPTPVNVTIKEPLPAFDPTPREVQQPTLTNPVNPCDYSIGGCQ